jgi:hypothetical protein
MTGWVPTVLAGNIAANTCLKLAAIDLHRLLDLDAGTYGADAEQRPDLIAVAPSGFAMTAGCGGTSGLLVVTPHETWKRLYDWFRDHHGLHWRSHPIGRCGCFRAGGHNRSDSHALSSNC